MLKSAIWAVYEQNSHLKLYTDLFLLCTNASDSQMGTMIIQEKQPVAFWSLKLTVDWIVTKLPYHEERNLLHCHGSQSFLLHASWHSPFHIYLSQKFNIHHSYWCCILHWHYIWKSMVPLSSITLARKMPLPRHAHCSNAGCVANYSGGENAPVVLFDFTSRDLDISNDPDLLKCFLKLPLPDIVENYPVDLKWIQSQ